MDPKRRAVLAAGLALPAIMLVPPVFAQATRMRSDPEAADAVERMLERLGGREVWARARTAYYEIEGWQAVPSEPVAAREWWHLREPRQRSEIDGRTFHTVHGLSPQESWTSQDGVVTMDDGETHRSRIEQYPFLGLPSLRALATGDPRFTLEWSPPRRVIARSSDGRERAWWEIDQTGAPIRRGTYAADGTVIEYVFGPLREFGTVSYPAWGARTDGSFRFYWTKLDVRPGEMTFSVAAPGEQSA